jgi:hypothetical protein
MMKKGIISMGILCLAVMTGENRGFYSAGSNRNDASKAVMTGENRGFYSTVDSEAGGAMAVVNASGDWIGDSTIFAVQFTAQNTGLSDLMGVGMTTQFVWSGDYVFGFDKSTHGWSYGDYWLKVYGVQGQNDLLSMDRAMTDAPLNWDLGGGKTGTLEVTDSVPVLWIGDVAAGETIDFTLYFQASTRFYADVAGFFVAVPEPGTVGLLAMAAMMAIRRKRNKNHGLH